MVYVNTEIQEQAKELKELASKMFKENHENDFYRDVYEDLIIARGYINMMLSRRKVY